MGKFIAFSYGAISYLIFIATFLYMIGFVGNIVVPRSIDSSGATTGLMTALLINALLLSLFAIQHSVMARPGFKEWWTKFIPRSVERSTYVLLASLCLILMYWQWRPIPGLVWRVDHPLGHFILIVLFWVGWGTVLLSTLMINHSDLFGLRQVYLNLRNQENTPIEFTTSGLYKYFRHPIMVGFIIAFWATPLMSIGHIFFALINTGYILFALQLEERDLVSVHGEKYEVYKQSTRMLIPLPKRPSAYPEK